MTGPPPGSARPLVVAHRAGNRPDDARAAARAGADLVEIDLHMRRGRLEVRHPRRLGPVLWDRERVALARGPAQAPEPVLAALGPAVEPMLDLKGGPRRLATRALEAARAAIRDRPVTISSRRWDLLDEVAGRAGVRALRSAAGRRELAALRRLGRDDGVAGVCVRRDLLTAAMVAALREECGAVLTWPVADLADARLLASWGVSGLVCDDLGLVAALASG